MEIEWTETTLEDMAGLDKGIARHIKQAAGNVKRLQGIEPPEFRYARRLARPLPPGRRDRPRPQPP